MYKLIYGVITGKVSGIKRLADNAQIPICEGNKDYQDFLKWNSKQATPLDLNSTIEVTPQPKPRDLAQELDDLKARIETLEKARTA